MINPLNIIKDLNPRYFWDVDINRLDVYLSKRLVIERVFTIGTVKEIVLVIKFYSRAEVLKVLQGLNYIDPKTLNFVSKLFRSPITSFKCYKRKQLIPQHWNS